MLILCIFDCEEYCKCFCTHAKTVEADENICSVFPPKTKQAFINILILKLIDQIYVGA